MSSTRHDRRCPLVEDGGGLVSAPLRPVSGVEKVARFLVAVQASGIANVYLAGDWIGAEGFLVDASMASAKEAAGAVMQGWGVQARHGDRSSPEAGSDAAANCGAPSHPLPEVARVQRER